VNIRQASRPRPTTAPCAVTGTAEMGLDQLMADYRSLLTMLFDDHRHPHSLPGAHDMCSCGAPWPCPKEERAAQLIDDWVQ
jgi:hypothetical protein